MSQDTPVSDAGSEKLATAVDKADRVYLVSYPKIIYMYPTVLTALFCGIFMWAKGGIPQDEIRVATVPGKAVAQKLEPFARAGVGSSGATESAATREPQATDTNAAAATGDTPKVAEAKPAAEELEKKDTYHNNCARVFLLVISLNLVVIAFDFPRTTSLTWFFAIVAMVIGIWFLLQINPWLAPEIVNALLKIKPAANSSFYLIFTALMLCLYIGVLISRRFDYWEVKGNELLHHHGFLSNLERFSAPNLRIDKEINDVFEYMLLRSGRFIIHASNERRAIVLENVLFINDKEERITKMLGALQVRVRTERE